MAFSNETISQVWAKAIYVDAENETRGFRKDRCGAWIKWHAYGDRDNKWGWEIDHIIPVSKGGSDNLNNLQPLHWQNNAGKADGKTDCAVTSSDTQNVRTRSGILGFR